ncbi:hypothetical protein [Streptomyces exfoliatus]|uniref:hypothetical protein n=1 Tax=Streptomyces exfoliatus TaxID=1905 RepID=UPI0012FF22A9|nr:hypothetical protein [Streptomyces exfoliatus]
MSALFAIMGGTLFSAQAATAAGYGCSGSLVDTYNVNTTSGTTYGKIYLYYSTSNGGTNCAVVVDTYFGSSTLKDMYIHIMRCPASTTPGSICAADGANPVDADRYYTYAGPVSVTSMAGRCVRISASLSDTGTSPTASRDTGAVHCG